MSQKFRSIRCGTNWPEPENAPNKFNNLIEPIISSLLSDILNKRYEKGVCPISKQMNDTYPQIRPERQGMLLLANINIFPNIKSI